MLQKIKAFVTFYPCCVFQSPYQAFPLTWLYFEKLKCHSNCDILNSFSRISVTHFCSATIFTFVLVKQGAHL